MVLWLPSWGSCENTGCSHFVCQIRPTLGSNDQEPVFLDLAGFLYKNVARIPGKTDRGVYISTLLRWHHDLSGLGQVTGLRTSEL